MVVGGPTSTALASNVRLTKRELLHEVASIDALGTSPPGSPSNDALVPSATVDRVRSVGTYATRGTNVQS